MAIRTLPTHAICFEQLDIFQPDWFTRVAGILPVNLTMRTWHNNTDAAWTLASGVGVTDAQVAVGTVYFQELSPGWYGLRWKPNQVGFWRLSFAYAATQMTITLDYDVQDLVTIQRGLTASFVSRT